MVKGRLERIACEQYTSHHNDFKDFSHFRDSIEKVYCLIANKTAKDYEQSFGKDYRIQGTELFTLGYNEISSNDFTRMLKPFRKNGSVRRVPYSQILDILVEEGVIVRNPHYSDKMGICKSYSLDNTWIVDCVESYQGEFDIYDALYGYYPNRLLDAKIKEARVLYEENTTIDGMYISLPEDWYKQVSLFGWFLFDDELDIDDFLSGMKKFLGQKVSGYSFGRYYDWFTTCSSSFRKYIYIGNKHYRELVDCHSGAFWMFAIYGYRIGEVSMSEAKKMIDWCFNGDFYSRMSNGMMKTKELKGRFMKVFNTHNGQLSHMIKSDSTSGVIYDNFRKHFPQWIELNDKMRDEYKGGIGLANHKVTTAIEQEIMTRLMTKLENEFNFTHLRRVHDALYSLEDMDGIDDVLYSLVMEEFA